MVGAALPPPAPPLPGPDGLTYSFTPPFSLSLTLNTQRMQTSTLTIIGHSGLHNRPTCFSLPTPSPEVLICHTHTQLHLKRASTFSFLVLSTWLLAFNIVIPWGISKQHWPLGVLLHPSLPKCSRHPYQPYSLTLVSVVVATGKNGTSQS